MSKRHIHQWGGPFNDFDNDPNTWGIYNQCVCELKRYWPWTRWKRFVERLNMIRKRLH